MRKYRAKLEVLGVYTALVALWTACALLLPNGRLREITTIVWLLTVPGYATWRALPTPKSPRLNAAICGYMLGISLLFLMVLGLTLNQLYAFLDAGRPFSRIPITVAVDVAVLAIGSVAAAKTKRPPGWSSVIKRFLKRTKFDSLTGAVLLSGLLLPVLAITGAITLNNGGSAGLAVVCMGAIAALFILLLMREKHLGKFYGYGLYCMCVSTLFATSMRGWNITGHDVMQEYQVFQLTLSHAAWHMSYYRDAYTACLSITILPTILQKVSGVDPQYIYKFVFQAIAALLAVVLYGSLRPYASRRVSLLAAFLFMTFPTFITDMSMLNRQEMGLLFFAFVLHAGTNKRLSRQLRSILVFLFIVGMILSHYSTSYVAIGALIVSLCAAFIWKRGAHLLRRPEVPALGEFTSIVSPIVLAASVLVLVGWGTIATQTSNNIAQTLQAIADTATGAKVPTLTLNQASATPTVSNFSKEAAITRIFAPNQYYSSQLIKKYPLLTAQETVEPTTSFAKSLHLPQPLLELGYDLFHSGYELLIIGAFGIGLVYCLFQKRTKFSLPRQYMLIALGTMVLIALQVAFPAAINYGVTRMLQQALVVFALPSVLAALWVLRALRIPSRASETIIGVVLAVFFLVLAGALPAITGGYKPSLTTANDGFYYAAYYTHQDEVSAARWLAYDTPKGSRIYTDEFMRRKLIAYGDIFSQPLVIPNAIPVDSYVMLSYGNLEFDQVPAYDGSALIYYKPPLAFLGQNKNLVYSSDNIRIYK